MTRASDSPSVRATSPLSRALRLLGLAALLTALAAYASFDAVSPDTALVVVRLGKPVRVVQTAGPCWHWPRPVDAAHRIDLRRRLAGVPATATWTRDKKNVLIGTFVVWHVADPLLFLQAAGELEVAESTLVALVVAAQSQEVSRHDLSALVSDDPTEWRSEDMELAIGRRAEEVVRERLGIAVDRVGFQRIELPPENVAAVLEKMRAEREAEAGRLRSEGAKMAQAVRDEAHVKSQQLLRTGREEAGRIAADAEREAAEEFARVERQDPEFFRFWTGLQASRRALGRNSVLVLRSDAPLFDSLFEGERADGAASLPEGAVSHPPDTDATEPRRSPVSSRERERRP